MEWEAYIHSNGQLQLKRFLGESGVQLDSPFVLHYLGVIEADTRDEALSEFTTKAREFLSKNL